MSVLEGLLAGIVADPLEETRWLVLADWLEEFDDPRRAELLRLHRRMLATCCEPERHPARSEWQARMVALLGEGVRPCLPQETITLPGGVEMTFSFIPPGSFLMGSDHREAKAGEKPVHRVTLTKGFFLGIHPVTQAQWRAITGESPSHFQGDNRPVENVSWDDAQEFCRKLTIHLAGRVKVGLPSEAEWEYACRAGTTTEFHFGDVITPDLANYAGNFTWNGSPKGKYRQETTEVGSFPSNSWGLFDMHGNVWEWCQNGYGPYSADDQVDPAQLSEHSNEYCILRGGCWCGGPICCRAAFRNWYEPATRDINFGFRCVFRLD
jgi:uncharacterized protein (TIGR02996 family)